VQWTRGPQNDDVVDARGRTAPKIAGAGIGVVVVVFLGSRIFGVDISGLLGGGGGSTPTPKQDQQPAPPKGADPDAELVDFVKFVITDVQDTFTQVFKDEGKTYKRAKLVLFSEAVETGCGTSSAAIGPFYCPPDQNAYIDLTFYRDLKARFGAPGDFAQAYVLAHEIGHHVQNLLGLEQDREKLAVSRDRNDHSVRVELQADCYAGVWGHYAAGKKLLEVGDLEEAITAATAIGDDRLQGQSGRQVNPETFTHGSSAQRVKWFRIGYDSGRLAACDTFRGEP